MDYENMLKAELVAECIERGLNSSGLKSELVSRLEAYDASESAQSNKANAKKRVWNAMLFRYEYK